MHNGMYKTLEEVIDHYDRKGDNKENLSPNMMGTEPLHLTEQEKKDLVEFLMDIINNGVNKILYISLVIVWVQIQLEHYNIY
jgi:cytochrome c peroxidase